MSGLKYFGTNEHKDRLVIFELERENIANIYIWVDVTRSDDGRVSLEPVSRIFSYKDHMVSPYWVSEDGVRGLIERALEILDEYPKDVLAEKLKGFEERYNNENGKFDRWYKELDAAEEEMKKAVEEAREQSGYWPWNPDDENA